jgi:cytochrome c biogenesis protein CcdA
MIRLLGVVVSIALADAMNPSTIAPALYLATGEHGRTSVLQFTLGVFAVNFAGGAIVALGPGQALLSLVPHPHPTVRYIIELTAGVVMLIGAAVLWRKRLSLARRELPTPSEGGKSSALLGVTIAAVELPTAFPYFAAIAAIVGSGYGPGHQVFYVAVYNVCFVLPLLVILGVLTFAPDRAESVLTTGRDLLQKWWPILLAGLALLAGVFVILLGITGLAGHGHGTAGRLSRKFRRVVH